MSLVKLELISPIMSSTAVTKSLDFILRAEGGLIHPNSCSFGVGLCS